jgi:penicillin-binding protein-related factor A (putative recombinase)
MIFDKVVISSGKDGHKINVAPLLLNPNGFFGDPLVDHTVKFNDLYVKIIGKYHGQFGPWNLKSLEKKQIFVLENYYKDAKYLMDKINDIAQKIVFNSVFYHNTSIVNEYFLLAKEGYEMLRKHEDQFKIEDKNLPVISLERAGLVTTRLALGKSKNAKLKNEIRVVTKRTHLIGEPTTNLSVTVLWRNKKQLKQINNQAILISDFVNPASGASSSAFILAAQKLGIKPSKIFHRSISLTQAGVLLMKRALTEMGIESVFYSVGVASELSPNYYLIGDRAVADAGHILRHFLPEK